MTLLEQIDRRAELKRIVKRNTPDGWTQQEAMREIRQIEANLAETERLAAIGRAVEAMPDMYALEHDAKFVGGSWRFIADDCSSITYGDTAAEALGVKKVAHDSE